MTRAEEQLSKIVNSMSQLERCKMEYMISGNKPEYLQGYEEAVKKACDILDDTLFPTVKTEIDGEIKVVNRHEFIDMFKKAIEK